MRLLQRAARWGTRRRSGRNTAFAVALWWMVSWAPAAAQADGGAAVVQAEAAALAAGGHCGSLVIRNCRLRPRTPSVVIASGQPVPRAAPLQWEAIRTAGPDPDEIVITGERLREPTPAEVFDRYLGPRPGWGSLLSRDAFGGARCSTILRTGATLCSSSGDVLPGMGTPVMSWGFSF